jgi:hypothetical protein
VGNGRELVLNPLDLDPGDRGPRERAEKHSPHGVAECHTETDIERLS